MKKNERVNYERPRTEVLDILPESVLCGSDINVSNTEVMDVNGSDL